MRLLLVLLFLACPAAAETVALDGRSYRIDLPPDPVGAPLIVMLHGGGGGPDLTAAKTGLSTAALPLGYAVAYPQGTGRLATWNGGYCCGAAARRGVDDLGFLDAVVADATARFGLDDTRVFAAGMSNGAIMAETWAAARPDRLAAAAAVAGSMDAARVTVQGRVPLLIIHGTADRQVPYAGGQGEDSRVPTAFSPVTAVRDAFLAPWGPVVRAQGLGGGDGERIRTDDYLARTGQLALRLVTIEGGGHVWPGFIRTVPPRNPPAEPAFSATAEMLQFFERVRPADRQGLP